MAGPFKAVSFDLFPIATYFELCPVEDTECTEYSFDTVQLLGYAGDEVVANDTFSMFDKPGLYQFGEEFAQIDRLSIGTAPVPIYPDPAFRIQCRIDPCSSFRIDSVTLDPLEVPVPVPLPASALLLVGALTGLGLARRRVS